MTRNLVMSSLHQILLGNRFDGDETKSCSTRGIDDKYEQNPSRKL